MSCNRARRSGVEIMIQEVQEKEISVVTFSLSAYLLIRRHTAAQ